MAGNPAGRRGETPGGPGGPFAVRDPPMGLHQLMAQSSLQLPCRQGARRELLRFILFPQFTWFQYRNTISKHFEDISLPSLSRGPEPCPAGGSSAALLDAFQCDGMLVLTRWSSVFLVAGTLKFQLFIFSCVIQPKFSLQ